MSIKNPVIRIDARRDAWCHLAGIKKSHARYNRVLPWLNQYVMPHGFDHIEIFYHPQSKTHILLTEPYHTAQKALQSLKVYADGRGFDYVLAKEGTGVWYPGACMALLVGKNGSLNLLEHCSSMLPE